MTAITEIPSREIFDTEERDHYADFLARKRLVVPPSGIDVAEEALHPSLFGFQKRIARWALKRGKAAVFAGTGTGKTRI